MSIGALVRPALAGLIPLALALAVSVARPIWWVALAPITAFVLARPSRRSGVVAFVVGVVLSATAAYVGPRARTLAALAFGDDAWPTVDPEHAEVADDAAYLQVDGWLRTHWVLDEYAVGQGAIPDQSRPPASVLAPIAASFDAEIAYDDVVFAARLPTVVRDRSEWVELRGRVEPMKPELMRTLAELAGAPAVRRGFVIDTRRAPTSGEAWATLFVVLGLALGGAAFYAYGRRM